MSAERARYEQLLDSLADGKPIDWAAIGGRGGTPEEERRFRNLRLVARIAELHRTIDIDDEEAPDRTAPDPGAESPAPIEQWGHLKIVRRLAVGAFGELYLAHDSQLDRDVALKLLRRPASDRSATPRLLHEARTLARVRHTNVVTVHGADVREGRAGLWMEFVEGRTLEAWLHDNGPLGAREAAVLGQDLCRALAAVHAAGLVHGDVKAQNVMREQRGRIVLMDFGAGQRQGSAAAVAGTPLYLAPEVLAGAPATPQSDIYSLGVLLFHLLTNRYPCFAADIDGIRAAHAQGVRTRLRDVRPDLSGAIVQAVDRALEPDPALRFTTAGEMEQALVERTDHTRRWVAGGLAAAAAIAAIALGLQRFGPPADARIDSLAVLPFAVASGAESNHLIAGLSAELVRELQRFDLEVKRVAPGADARDAAALERRVGTDALVRGAALRVDGSDHVRVSVVRAGSSELWAQVYALDERLPTLARRVANEIAANLAAHLRAGAPAVHQPNYAAYDAYQRGRVLWEQRDPAQLERSLKYFERAAALDAAYAQPWAGMADAYISLGVPAFGPLAPMEARRLAKEAALKALSIDPNLVEAHASLAFSAFFHDWDWGTAERRFKEALALNPQYAPAHHWYADYLNAMQRHAEAMTEIERARVLEPMSSIIHRDVAWHLFFQKKYAEAADHLRETLRLDPDYAAARTLLGRALAEQGDYDGALEELRRAATKSPSVAIDSFIAYVEARKGNRAGARRWLRAIEQNPRGTYVSPYYVALVHLALGDRASALDALERGYREQDTTMVNVKADPRMEPLREDARYKRLIGRMRFPVH
jgi:serine/threonine-protein kinase